jgi:hypothetical protein
MEGYEWHCNEVKAMVRAGRIPQPKIDSYFKLVERVKSEMLPHEVITNNQYTRWFKEVNLSPEEVKHFLQQFSVFSNLFIEAQLKKVINAPTLEAMHQSKEILMNELGVVFRAKGSQVAEAKTSAEIDDQIANQQGSIEGGTFKFAAAHFEWLLRMTSHVGLTFKDLGKRRNGTKSTLFFCDELSRLYGSEDPHIALGASFAVENWAAAGFWKELIQGLERFKKEKCPQLPLAFFTWHDRVEDQHAAHTWHELEEEFFAMDLDQEKFFTGAKEMLNGVLAFWNGLNQDRLKRG